MDSYECGSMRAWNGEKKKKREKMQSEYSNRLYNVEKLDIKEMQRLVKIVLASLLWPSPFEHKTNNISIA